MPTSPQRAYGSPDDFLSDLRAIATNAKRYNCPPAWLPSRETFLPHPDEVRAKYPAQWQAAPVYRMAWDFERAVGEAEAAARAAWDAAFRAEKRRVLVAAGISVPIG